ncbi:MAG: PucR family transcriptional regulator [Suipraeoptans sp.]
MDDKLKKQLNELEKIIGVKLEIASDIENESDELEITKLLSDVVKSYKSKKTIASFLYHIISEEVIAQQISEDAKALHVSVDEQRALYLIEAKSNELEGVMSVLKNIYPPSSKSYLTSINETSIALVVPIAANEPKSEIEENAYTILSTVNAEAMASVYVSASDVFASIIEVKNAYLEALQAMQVGKLFRYGEEVFFYSNLGVGGLLSDTSIKSSDKYLKEVFGNEEPKNLDEESSSVVNEFLKNNLNIAETARSLHMHRNTLIYRIEQIEKHTGLDIRKFEDAMQFKMALMVYNYRNQRGEVNE